MQKFNYNIDGQEVKITVYKMYAWIRKDSSPFLAKKNQELETLASVGMLPPVTTENSRDITKILVKAVIPHTQFTGAFTRQKGDGKHPVAYLALIEVPSLDFYLTATALKSAKDPWNTQKGLSLLHSRIIQSLTSFEFDVSKSTRKEIARDIGVKVSEEGVYLSEAIEAFYDLVIEWVEQLLDEGDGDEIEDSNPIVKNNVFVVDKNYSEESKKEKAKKWLADLEATVQEPEFKLFPFDQATSGGTYFGNDYSNLEVEAKDEVDPFDLPDKNYQGFDWSNWGPTLDDIGPDDGDLIDLWSD